MRILDLLKVTERLYESGAAVHIVGPPGGGKSSVIRNEVVNILSARYNESFGCAVSVAPTLDAPDYKGFLVPTKDAAGNPISVFTRSPEIPSESYLAAHPRGIMLIDELSSSEHLTQKALAGVILEKTFGNHKLPDGWRVWCASNRAADRAGALRMLSHIRNRTLEITLEADALSWAVWAEANGIHPLIISWAKQSPTVAFVEEVPNTDRPFSTARSVALAAKILQVGMRRDSEGRLTDMELPTDSLVQQAVYGAIGEGAGANLFGFLQVWDKLPTLEEILNDPKGAKCPQELSAGWAAGQMCLHFSAKDNIDKLWTYIERLPREIQVSMAKSLLERSGSALLNSPALISWIHKHKALITASTGV
jgi:hypothetical protein